MTREEVIKEFESMTESQKECVCEIVHSFTNSFYQAVIFKAEAVRNGFMATPIDSELMSLMFKKKETK